MKNDPGKDAAYARCVVALLVPAALLNHLECQMLTVMRFSVMAKIGVEVGLPRLLQLAVTAQQVGQLRGESEALGFFDWIRC
jgi:hypothetical protein